MINDRTLPRFPHEGQLTRVVTIHGHAAVIFAWLCLGFRSSLPMASSAAPCAQVASVRRSKNTPSALGVAIAPNLIASLSFIVMAYPSCESFSELIFGRRDAFGPEIH